MRKLLFILLVVALASTGYAKPKPKLKVKSKAKSKSATAIGRTAIKEESDAVKLTKKASKRDKSDAEPKPTPRIDKVAAGKDSDAKKMENKVAKSAKKQDYKFIPSWKKDKHDLYPQLAGRHVQRDSYFGYLDEQIEDAYLAGDIDKATEIADKYDRLWDSYMTKPPERKRR